MGTNGKDRYLRRACSLFCAALLVVTGCGEAGKAVSGEGADTPAAGIGASKGAEKSGTELPGGGEADGAENSGGAAGASAESGEKAGASTESSEKAGASAESGVKAGASTESGEETGTSTEPAVYGEPGQLAAYDPDRAHYGLKIRADEEVHEISDLLYGIFFEDINFAADGGLYAEMVQNRSFEFTSLAQGNEKHAWRDVGDITANVVTDDPEGALNCNNTNYMVLTNSTAGTPAGIANRGFLEGMAVEEGKSYRCSLWARGLEGYDGDLNLAITEDGESMGEAVVSGLTGEWQYYEVLLEPVRTANKNVELQLTIGPGSVAVDMVSLFPTDTYQGRVNGLRADLAEKLEALQPKFLRFPGGCVVEGVSLELAYDWKDSIGVDREGNPCISTVPTGMWRPGSRGRISGLTKIPPMTAIPLT